MPCCDRSVSLKSAKLPALLFISLAMLLAGCGTTPTDDQAPSAQQAGLEDAFSNRIDELVAQIDAGRYTGVSEEISLLRQQAYSSDHYSLLAYAQARLLLAQGRADEAYHTLNNSESRQHHQLASLPVQVRLGLFSAELLALRDEPLAAARQRIFLAPLLASEEMYLDNHQRIWSLLNQLDIKRIDLSQFRQEQVLAQWLNLNRLVQSADRHTLPQQVAAIEQWQQQNPWHPAARKPPAVIDMLQQAGELQPQKVAIILPLHGKFRRHGIAIRDGLMRAYFHTDYQPELVFYSFDEMPGFIDVYNEAIYDGADLVIGPLFKEQLKELYTLEQLPVPTLALNRLDTPPQQPQPENLYQYSLSIEDEVDSIIHLAKAWHHRNAITINQADSWAEQASDYFTRHWQGNKRQVLSRVSFDNAGEQSAVIQQALNIDKSKQRYRELQWLTGLSLEHEPRRRRDIDMIMLLARPDAASSVRPLLSFHYAQDIPVYATSSVYRGYPEDSNKDLKGIRFTDIPLLIHDAENIHSDYRSSAFIRFYAFGMDAFHLSERLALMAEIPQLHYYGATGRLHIEQNAINRQTDYAFFIGDGIKPVSLPAEQAAAP